MKLTDHDALKQRLLAIGRDAFVNLPDRLRGRVSPSVIHCQFNRDDMGIRNAKALSSVSPSYGTVVYEISNAPIHMAPDEVLHPKGIYDRVALTAKMRRIRVPLLVYESVDGEITMKKVRV